MTMEPENLQQLKKLAPFVVRSHAAVTGRLKLVQQQRKLAFVLMTTDVSENSRKEVLRELFCPVYQALTMAEVEELFHLSNTKILGFRLGGMGASLQRCFQGCLITAETAKNPATDTEIGEKSSSLQSEG